jgi:small redox-active disulfide protein 2
MVKKVQILGPGCANCRRLAERIEEVARQLEPPPEIEKVEALDRIVSMGVVRTPALALDGAVVVAGRVPSVSEIEGLLRR